jgi:ABC-type phosphate transport system substrate-binding protein
MTAFSARRSACVLSAVMAAALMAPSLASAKVKPPEQCSGAETIEGKGSTLQNNAQKVWVPKFNSSTNATACNGKNGDKKEVKVTYNKSGVTTGSVHGMEAFGLNKHGVEPAFNFVGTDESPDAEQRLEMEEANKKAAIETIPVVQASVAILIHLPKKCTAENTTGEHAGRLVLSNESLGKIFAGTEAVSPITTWGGILTANTAAGDEIKGTTGAEKTECEEAKFMVNVRADGSGTTHILKRYLSLIGTETINGNHEFELEAPNEAETAASPPEHFSYNPGNVAKAKWASTGTEKGLDQGTLNQVWPKGLNKLREGEKLGGKGETIVTEGGGKLALYTFETENTISYANLSDARPNGFAPEKASVKVAGKGEPIFWAPVENAAAKGKKPATYADPSTDGEASNSATNANCTLTKYTNGTEKFPPKSTVGEKGIWSEVTTALVEKNYTLCGLTFDLAFENYETSGRTIGEGTSVRNYLLYVLSETGPESGQAEIVNNDYLTLGSKLDKTAKKGVELIP